MFTAGTLLSGSELNPLQHRTAFRQMGYAGVPNNEVDVPAGHCLRLWVFMLLGRLSFLSPEQRTLLIEEMSPQLDDLGETMAGGLCDNTPMLVIGDARYATWHGKQGFLDLESGQVQIHPERDILESVAYNLGVLFARNRAACHELQERSNAAERRANPS